MIAVPIPCCLAKTLDTVITATILENFIVRYVEIQGMCFVKVAVERDNLYVKVNREKAAIMATIPVLAATVTV
jgi:hypothetical protein